MPAYGPDGVRHRGSAIHCLRLLRLNCGNLRRRCRRKARPEGEADSSEAAVEGTEPSRGSVETAAMAEERRDGVIWRAQEIGRATGRIFRDLQIVRHSQDTGLGSLDAS